MTARRLAVAEGAKKGRRVAGLLTFPLLAAIGAGLLAPPPAAAGGPLLEVSTFSSHLERRQVGAEEQRRAPFNGVLKLTGRYDTGGGRLADLNCSAPIVSDHLIIANRHCITTNTGDDVGALSAFSGFRDQSYAREFLPRLIWEGRGGPLGRVVILAVDDGFPPDLTRFQIDPDNGEERIASLRFIGFSRDIEDGRVLTFARRCINHLELRRHFQGLMPVECDFVQNASAAPLYYESGGADGGTVYRLVGIVEGAASRTGFNLPFRAETANLAIPVAQLYGTINQFEELYRRGRPPRALATFASVLTLK